MHEHTDAQTPRPPRALPLSTGVSGLLAPGRGSGAGISSRRVYALWRRHAAREQAPDDTGDTPGACFHHYLLRTCHICHRTQWTWRHEGRASYMSTAR
jgi:hypothetical protein